MPTDVFGRGHAAIGYQHAHEGVGMAPGDWLAWRSEYTLFLLDAVSEAGEGDADLVVVDLAVEVIENGF